MTQKVGVIDDWVYVYKQYIPNKVISDLQCKIIIRDNGADYEEYINFYDEINNDIIAIPRYCEYAKYLYDNNMLIDNRSDGADIDISINVEPRDHFQVNAINSMIANEHGILCAKTAFGKTYVAINTIAQLKKRALILMHKKELMQQWKADIIKYTNLTEDDVQIFTGTNFEKNKAITITTVQNIAAKIRNECFDIREQFKQENFGITIYDECHTTVGPLSNSLSSRYIFSKRLFGLSATPWRSDDLDKVINYILGDIIYRDDRKMLPVFVSFSPVNVDISSKTKYYLNFSKTQYTLRYNKWMSKQETYINHCANLILSLIKANRKILAVASLKELLQVIYERVYSLLGDNNMNVDKIRLVHGTSDAKLKGIMSMTDEDIENFNCIFSTNKFFSDGISISWLDTIICLTGLSSKSLSAIPQLVGRIVREYKGKRFVNVIDIYNSIFEIECARQKKRITAYTDHKYNIISADKNMLLNMNSDAYVKYILEASEALSRSNNVIIPFDNINIDI